MILSVTFKRALVCVYSPHKTDDVTDQIIQ